MDAGPDGREEARGTTFHTTHRSTMTSAMTVRLEISGLLSADLAEWLEPLDACPLPSGNTLCTGTVPDQAAVHALCNRLRDLGIALSSLTITQKELDS
jgi:hypothetical protein